MRNLLLSSFFILLLSACHPGGYSKLSKNSSTGPTPKPLFGENFNSFLFKANISVYGKELSGLLVTKQLAPGDFRVIFTTEMGIKLFDFQFKDTSFTLHYCIPQFNRPKLLKVIRQDIETLLMNDKDPVYEQLSDPATNTTVFRKKDKEHYLYYFQDKNGQLQRIERGSKRSQKVIYHLREYKENFPSSIFIDHKDTRLKMELGLLRK
jgi:hypothetical protein